MDKGRRSIIQRHGSFRAVIFLSFLLLIRFSSAANSISQYGITWTFDKDITADGAGDTYQYGTFVNGDYWVVGPVNIVAIDPAWEIFGGRLTNGSQVNPTNDWVQGYDEDAPWYDTAVNAGIGVSESTPLHLSAHSSLVSSHGLETPTNETQVSDAAVLTVLPEAPPADAFRPPYCGNDKSIRFTTSDLHYGVLKKLTGYDAPDIADCAKDFERPRIDHPPIPHGQKIRPYYNYNGGPYGRDLARASTNAALVLNLDFTDKEKETLLIRYVQYGIDLFGIIQTEGEGWHGDGGHSGGRKLPILFAGMVLDDEDMLSIGNYSGQYLYTDPYGPGDRPPDYKDFGEDAQTFYVDQLDVDITHNDSWWAPDSRDLAIPYETSDKGVPEWSQTHSHAPKKCTNWWDAIYREVAGCTFPGVALTAHIMGFQSLWNNPAFFDYCDRYMNNITANASFTGWQTGTNGVGYFVFMLWRMYRNDYGCQWVPDDTADLYAQGKTYCSRCLYNCTGIFPAVRHAIAPDQRAQCRVVPNPMTDAVVFDWDGAVPGSALFAGPHGTSLLLTIYGRDGNPLYRERARNGVPLRWDGTDFAGDRVPPGTYCYTMHIDGREIAGKILKTE